MSDVNEILDAFAARLVVIDPALAGSIERDTGPGWETITVGEFPKAYIYNASEVRTRLPWRQNDVILRFVAELWRNDGQRASYALVQAVVNDLKVDPYMGLTDIEDAFVAETDPIELPEQQPIGSLLQIQVQRFE